MRGKALQNRPDRCGMGITPAYAGKRQVKKPQEDRRLGSPPRMRGKVQSFVNSFVIFRITPAYAGKSDKVIDALYCHEDHPRVCGEKASSARRCLPERGSPPRMRGKVTGYIESHMDERITPAYAGKSCPKKIGRNVHRDHPRVCGEKCQKYCRRC